MEFSEFVNKAILQDKRNVFSQYDGDLDGIPDELKAFYRDNNPTDVEVNGIRFFAAEELSAIQEEYSYLNAQFIFATCNGDPIFLHDGHVYTCPHGVKTAKWELLTESFANYLESLI